MEYCQEGRDRQRRKISWAREILSEGSSVHRKGKGLGAGRKAGIPDIWANCGQTLTNCLAEAEALPS